MSAAPNLTLYSLASEYQTVIDDIEANGGEISDELSLRLSEIVDYFEVKAEKVALFIRNQQGLALAAEDEAKRLAALADQRKKTANSLKHYLFTMMLNTGKEKIDRPLAKLSIANNGGSLPVMYNGAPDTIPEPYRKTVVSYSLDKEKVLEAHKAGVELPVGVSVGVRGRHLRIA